MAEADDAQLRAAGNRIFPPYRIVHSTLPTVFSVVTYNTNLQNINV
jgi:hypothetical protein